MTDEEPRATWNWAFGETEDGDPVLEAHTAHGKFQFLLEDADLMFLRDAANDYLNDEEDDHELVTDGGQLLREPASDIVAIEYVEGPDNATAYTVVLARFDPEQDPALQNAGYYSEKYIYGVLTAGDIVFDYDRHRLVRALPGDADWLHDEFRRIAEGVVDA